MRKINETVAPLLFGITVFAAPTTAAAQPLKSLQWEKRPLLIFAPSANHPLFTKQRAIIQQARSGLAERDMIVIEITGNAKRTTLGSSPSASAAAFRRHYGIGMKMFRVMLVGKDGGQKLVSGNVVSSGRLFDLIDSMPMRRNEMRRQSQ